MTTSLRAIVLKRAYASAEFLSCDICLIEHVGSLILDLSYPETAPDNIVKFSIIFSMLVSAVSMRVPNPR